LQAEKNKQPEIISRAVANNGLRCIF
jgi:hypothetical protein